MTHARKSVEKCMRIYCQERCLKEGAKLVEQDFLFWAAGNKMDLKETNTRICAGFIWLKCPRRLQQQQHWENLKFAALLQLLLLIVAPVWAIGSACILVQMPYLLCSRVVSGKCRHLYRGILPYPNCRLIFFVSSSFLPVLVAVFVRCILPVFITSK